MTQSSPNTRLAIIGAGPIGLEAALEGQARGFDVTVFERGEIADHVRQWGHVRLFSPFDMNSTEQGRAAVSGAGEAIPPDDALLTGKEFADRYLLPLANLPQLKNRILEQSSVESIARTTLGKGDAIGEQRRADDSFRLLIRSNDSEHAVEADVVFDCSGTYGRHRWIGAGGQPCPGERSSLSEDDHRLPDITGRDRDRFANQKTLIVGGGYSAATAIAAIGQLATEFPDTSAAWITRQRTELPITPIPEDSLVERDRLTSIANQLATDSTTTVSWKPGQLVSAIERIDDGSFSVSLEPVVAEQNGEEQIRVDQILGLVGCRPDNRLYEELQVHECYASQGPIKLAAALLGDTSGDCLNQSAHGPDVLRNPEPNFFILGAKSYGRDSRFLLQIGHRQILDAFELLES